MRIAVITGGPLFPEAESIARDADQVFCADSGLDHCIRFGIKPDRVFGDMDSVSGEGLEFLKRLQIPVVIFPPEKDVTDSDIALEACGLSDEVTLICPLEGRIDHVVTNLGLLIKYKKTGLNVTATDGRTDVIPLTGKEKISIGGISDPSHTAISLIPMCCDKVEGVTTEGLYYALTDSTVYPDSSLYVSNRLTDGNDSFSVSILSGSMVVTISKNV